ncbi:copper homeostasis protein CutC [Phytohabitans rumicis]|uniref:PF03932 family protein CutC n=1 Tax=Phytohabitans rumicis TaxID=1076125 RepID=A0A6V8LC80_9ACTN|nr:copper homeostasis protein CutC [Phytohabitans rumicis]GFJ91657.1 copper homeostasis protein CutC [Phytohabitans rumicis]
MPLFAVEVCVDSVSGVLAAQEAGADRVELCCALFEGGLTPSTGLIEAAREAAPIGVNVLIRPRGGDFIYDSYEVRAMLRDIEVAASSGANGVVLGALTPDGDVDVPLCRQLMAAAGGLSVTFHRAFDMARRPLDALEAVIDLGVDRLLTSGQEASALEGTPLIAELVAAAGDRVVVMAGGGITERNVARILSQTGVREVHFTARATVDSPARYRNTRVAMGGALRAEEYTHRRTSPSAIESIIAATR